MKMKLSQMFQVGLDFTEFLKETRRDTIRDRQQLRDIYNNEFRYRPERRAPNFSGLLFALTTFNRATTCGRKVCFSPPRPYQDQWYNSSRRKKPVQNGSCSPGPSQTSLRAPVPGTRAPVPGTRAPVPGTQAPVPGTQARRKLARLLMVKLKKDTSWFVSDKNGVVISSEHEDADKKICLNVEDEDEHVVRVCVRNGGVEPVCFTYYTLLNWIPCFTLDDPHRVTRAHPLTLAPGDRYEVQVLVRTGSVGFYPATLAFEFRPGPPPSAAAFHIVRYLEVRRTTALGRELAPVAPYRVYSITATQDPHPCRVEDGQRPESQSVMHLKVEVELQRHLVPSYMNRLIHALKTPDVKTDQSTRERKAVLDGALTMETYRERFQLLLYLEEMQMLVDIKRYNIPNSDGEHRPMYRDTANKKLLVLKVPGVAENRPSVLRGDSILVWPQGERGVKYRGYVHSVEQEWVKLGFSSKLLGGFVDGMAFGVEFTVGRVPLRLQHRAAGLAVEHGLGEVLFPTAPPPPPRTDAELPSLRLFDGQLERNQEQYKAVQHIVAGSSRPAPYLVFGPPGTGKTVTVVEAIKQIEKTRPCSRILACAPSNSASDLLCKKLLDHVDKHKVFRMYASSWDPKRVPPELKACSNHLGDGVYEYPSKEELLNYTIIVVTLCTAGRLVTGGIPPGHFTHVFVDEAGHAVETECIIPIAGLLQPESGQVVLAGDPKQLGPILRSPLVQQYGLGESLLQRLMETTPVYQKIEVDDGEEDEVRDEDSKQETFDPRFVTKLLCNYRSHPAILKKPNELFYDGELKVCSNEMLRNSYCRWEHLPKMGFPVIFHGVTGVDEREMSSPSFFNVAEVEQLMEYVRKLLEKDGRKGRAKLLPKDIGIIAPYRKQVQKIRKGLQILEKELKLNLTPYLKVGSVEEFQGQERMVVLVSTVRSDPKYTDLDQHFSLGFVKNEKRFNVAVTRAKALLIMVGNPRVLSVDPVWNSFIEYCKESGGYTGFLYTEEEEQVVDRLSSLFISMEPQVETDESALQQHLDPEWRNEL